MRLQLIQPDGWPKPKGYANGVLVTDPSRFVFVAGQIAWDENQELVGPGGFGLHLPLTSLLPSGMGSSLDFLSLGFLCFTTTKSLSVRTLGCFIA